MRGLFFRVDVDRARARQFTLLRLRVGRCVRVLHAFFKALYGAAQIAADVAQFLRAEHQSNDQQNDQPMPDTQRTHENSPCLPSPTDVKKNPWALQPELERKRSVLFL